MKKILFAALALIVVMASCVKDEPYSGINISGVSYSPTAMTEVNDVTVTAAIASFYTITEATLCYTLNDVDEVNTVNMTMAEATKEYSAVIPAYPNDTKVVFWVKAVSEKMQAESEKKEYVVGAVPPDYSVIVLNELNGDTKFIEIYNMGDYDLPLKGMYLVKDDKPDIIWTADEAVVAPAHGYVLLYSEDVTAVGGAQAGYPANLTFHSGLSPKKALKMELFLPDGTSGDIFTRGEGNWGTEISNVKPKSFARTPDGGDWKLADATPGEANPETGDDIPQD